MDNRDLTELKLERRECETFSRAYSSETLYHSFVLGSNKTNLAPEKQDDVRNSRLLCKPLDALHFASLTFHSVVEDLLAHK